MIKLLLMSSIAILAIIPFVVSEDAFDETPMPKQATGHEDVPDLRTWEEGGPPEEIANRPPHLDVEIRPKQPFIGGPLVPDHEGQMCRAVVIARGSDWEDGGQLLYRFDASNIKGKGGGWDEDNDICIKKEEDSSIGGMHCSVFVEAKDSQGARSNQILVVIDILNPANPNFDEDYKNSAKIFDQPLQADNPPQPSAPEGMLKGGSEAMFNIEDNVDRLGSDYDHFTLPAADPNLCADECAKNSDCKAFTYVKPGVRSHKQPECWLKDGVPNPLPNKPCCISGIKRQMTNTADMIR